jgi:hypothetical protein
MDGMRQMRHAGIRGSGQRPGRTLDEALARMEGLGAGGEGSEEVRRTVGVFLRWAERRERTSHRAAGITWLLAIRERLESELMAGGGWCGVDQGTGRRQGFGKTSGPY